MVVTLLGMVMLGKLVQYSNALLPITVTLLLFAKITEVTVASFATQAAGMSPVFVEPTCTPEELKALEVVMGGGGAEATLVCGNDKPKPSFGMAVYAL